MTNYAWEHGTVTLPAAAVPVLKKALREHVNALHEAVRIETVRLHRAVGQGTRNRVTYLQRVREHRQALHACSGYARSAHPRMSDQQRLVTSLALEVLERMLYQAPGRPAPTPHQPTVADVSAVIAKRTNRDTVFPVFSSGGYSAASISFDGRQVTWDVPENNHATDGANESTVAKIFFDGLRRTAWTRGTGGTIWGNSEYNEAEHGHGRRPDYIVRTFGPAGDDARVGEYMGRGFTRAQATQMVASAARPVTRRAYAW